MALEAKVQLQPFDPATLAAVDVWLHPRAHALIGQPFRMRQNPQVDAQFSAQWTVAFVFLHGPPGLADFAPEAVRAATEVQSLTERIRVHRLPSAEPGTHERLTLRLQDGREAAITHTDIKGEPSLPLTRSERKEKFLACALYAHHPLDANAAENIFDALECVEEHEDIRPLSANLAPHSPDVGSR